MLIPMMTIIMIDDRGDNYHDDQEYDHEDDHENDHKDDHENDHEDDHENDHEDDHEYDHLCLRSLIEPGRWRAPARSSWSPFFINKNSTSKCPQKLARASKNRSFFQSMSLLVGI